MAIVLTRAAGIRLGNALRLEDTVQPSGPLFEASVGLYTAGPSLTPSMVYADFIAATFPGYAAATAQTWNAAYIDQENKVQLASPVMQFVRNADAGDPQTVLGFYVWIEGTPDVLVLADAFETPIVFAGLNDGVAFVITVEFDLTGHGSYIFML